MVDDGVVDMIELNEVLQRPSSLLVLCFDVLYVD